MFSHGRLGSHGACVITILSSSSFVQSLFHRAHPSLLLIIVLQIGLIYPGGSLHRFASPATWPSKQVLACCFRTKHRYSPFHAMTSPVHSLDGHSTPSVIPSALLSTQDGRARSLALASIQVKLSRWMWMWKRRRGEEETGAANDLSK